jgi:hypothetical protein
MLAKPLLSHILDDDALTRGLGDPEARVLVEWLVEQADGLAAAADSEETIGRQVRRLCRRARSLGCFVRLWCYEGTRGAAVQLAAVERFGWPLPTTRTPDPCELMQGILVWEADNLTQTLNPRLPRTTAA